MTLSDRSPDQNPRERWTDVVEGWRRVPAWVWHHKLYRDVWLIIISIVLFGAVQTNGERVDEVQRERARAIRLGCQETNDRNRNTIAVLRKGAAQDIADRKTEAEKAEVRRRRDVTIGLINAIAPVRDCDDLVKRSVSPDATPDAERPARGG